MYNGLNVIVQYDITSLFIHTLRILFFYLPSKIYITKTLPSISTQVNSMSTYIFSGHTYMMINDSAESDESSIQ